jgi:hypothetical protein
VEAPPTVEAKETPPSNGREEVGVSASGAGLLTGLLLGLALILEGFGEMLIVALCGAIGYVVVKVLEGELDLSQFVGRSNRRLR